MSLGDGDLGNVVKPYLGKQEGCNKGRKKEGMNIAKFDLCLVGLRMEPNGCQITKF